jgi:AraC-like DNA-binding protein
MMSRSFNSPDPVPDAMVDPLHRFPVFRTSDPEQLRHVGSTLFGVSGIDLKCSENFDARVNMIELPEIALAFGATSSEISIDHHAADFIRLLIAHRGRASTTVAGKAADVDERQFAIAPSGVPWGMVCEAGHERLTLRLDRQALMQRLTALLGVKPKGAMNFEMAVDAEKPYARSLSNLVHFLSQQLDSTAARLPDAVCRELEQAVQIAFLCVSRHSFSHLMESQENAADSKVVRRLEEFVEAHWQEAITIDRLAAESGVSTRAIFRAFERSRGYSPMAFVKAVRLRRAREILASGDPGVSVTATAFRCNFASPGHFAREYREAFGELPSETVYRTRQ